MVNTIAIVGSRNFDDRELVTQTVRDVCNRFPHALIISGGARGVDRLAIKVANQEYMETETINARWDDYGKKAGAIRNKEMVERADFIIAFWDSNSAGTKITIDMALKEGKPVDLHIRQ